MNDVHQVSWILAGCASLLSICAAVQLLIAYNRCFRKLQPAPFNMGRLLFLLMLMFIVGALGPPFIDLSNASSAGPITGEVDILAMILGGVGILGSIILWIWGASAAKISDPNA